MTIEQVMPKSNFFFQIPMIIYGQVTVFENIVFSSALVGKKYLDTRRPKWTPH